MRVLAYTVAADGTKQIDGLPELGLDDIAVAIALDWGKVNFAAKPYLDAMRCLASIEDDYYADDGASVVAYFLSNATSWRGDIARQIKAELKTRLAKCYA